MRGLGFLRGTGEGRRWVLLGAIAGLALCHSSCRRAPSPQRAAQPAKAPQQASGLGPEREEPCPSWQTLDSQALTPAADTMQAKVLQTIWDKVRLRHFDPTLNCLDWVGLRAHYLRKLAGLEQGEASYALYNELLGKLEQSHLVAVPPAPLIRNRVPNQGPAKAAIHWTWLDGRLYLRGPRPGESRPAKAHRSGEIVGIDATPVSALFSKPSASDKGVGAAVLDLMERERQTLRQLSCPKGGTKQLEIRRPGQGPVQLKVPCVDPKLERSSLGNLRDIETRVLEQMLDPRAKVGYLAFNVWMLPMLPKLRAAMGRLQSQGMRSLILDLRGNPGGVASMTIPVARLLWPEGGSLGTITMRDFKQALLVRPNPAAFAGKIILLLDRQSASTTEIFALGMLAAKRVEVLAASASAGMALASIIEGLPDGGLLQYVIGRYQSPLAQEAEGRGVAPHRLVSYGPADLHAQRDPVLDSALASLGSKLRTPLGE